MSTLQLIGFYWLIAGFIIWLMPTKAQFENGYEASAALCFCMLFGGILLPVKLFHRIIKL